MRMRKKKNLSKRLENIDKYLLVKNEPNFYDKLELDRYNYLNLAEIFGNDNKVELEIGCGKGQFINELARKNVNINFLAVEKIANVIISGIEKTQNLQLKNLFYLNCGAENLLYFLKEKTISRIYLNFSCPYPKNQYENNRLTYRNFLDKYKKILVKNGGIFLKTDNMHFFEYSLQSLSENGFILKNISLDLHKSNVENNIETEYEQKFIKENLPIYKLEAFIK